MSLLQLTEHMQGLARVPLHNQTKLILLDRQVHVPPARVLQIDDPRLQVKVQGRKRINNSDASSENSFKLGSYNTVIHVL